MYKMVLHRYGKASLIEEEDLKSLIELGSLIEEDGEGFVECYLDESNKILSDESLKGVVGIKYDSRAGEKYNMSVFSNE